MIVECGHGHKNRVSDTPEPGKSYRCSLCKEPLHIVWGGGAAEVSPNRSYAITSKIESVAVSRVPVVVSTVMLAFAAFGRWPYGFYTILRLVTCGTAIYLAWASKELNRKVWAWIMVAIALLFNPFIPIRLTRDVWMYLDMSAALVFGVSVFFIRQSGRQLNP